jgi:hypothetical protein
MLGVLLKAAVQVADVGPGVFNNLPIGLDFQAQHAVGARVLRPHVNRHDVALETVVLQSDFRRLSGPFDGDLCFRYALLYVCHIYTSTLMPR